MADNQAMLQWPGWETLRVIGSGNGGTVYELERATNSGTEKAALKAIAVAPLPEDAGVDRKTQARAVYSRLQRMAQIYSVLNANQLAPNILRCDELSCLPRGKNAEWDVYLRTELLTPLSRAVEMNPSEDTVIRLGMDVCRALMVGRKNGIVHLDIKPQNIFRAADGSFKLGDFGMAGLRPADISSISYMAPECFYRRQAGHQADIYSLGMILFWLLNVRRLPFLPLPPAVPTETDAAQARERRFGAEPIPDPIHGSEPLKRIIRKACSFAPGQRYQTADEMLRDLASVPAAGASAEPTAAKPAALPEKREQKRAPAAPVPPAEREERKRPRVLPWIIALLLVAALAIGGVCAWRTGFFGLLEPVESAQDGPEDGPELTPEPTPAPTPTPEPTPEPGPEIPAWTDAVKEGDIVRFGSYEQDGDPSDGAEPIRWIVLAREDERLLLLSSRGLDCQPFHSAGGDAAWADSSLRGWLNRDFFDTAFDAAQQSAVLSTALSGSLNSVSGLSCEATEDRVFLLSEEEARLYLGDRELARTDATAYALEQGAYRHKDNARTWWWLRTPGKDPGMISYITTSGELHLTGSKSDSKTAAVRPALWIDMKTAVAENCLEEDGPRALSEAQRGDTVLFGRFEQDADAADGPEDIEWIVLDRKGDRVLLLSRYCVDAQPFRTEKENTTWSESSLRAWLNGDFAEAAFDESEQARLIKVDLEASANPQYDTYSGSRTSDRVFLLSCEEAVQYMPAASERCTVATAYAAERGAFVNEDSGYSWWWLRTSGKDRQHAVYVYSYGDMDYYGDSVAQTAGGVRPAIWVSAG